MCFSGGAGDRRGDPCRRYRPGGVRDRLAASKRGAPWGHGSPAPEARAGCWRGGRSGRESTGHRARCRQAKRPARGTIGAAGSVMEWVGRDGENAPHRPCPRPCSNSGCARGVPPDRWAAGPGCDDGRRERCPAGHRQPGRIPLRAPVDGLLALSYRRNGNGSYLIHAPPCPRNSRAAASAVPWWRAAIDRAVREGLTVGPLCPFARGWCRFPTSPPEGSRLGPGLAAAPAAPAPPDAPIPG